MKQNAEQETVISHSIKAFNRYHWVIHIKKESHKSANEKNNLIGTKAHVNKLRVMTTA